MLVIVRPTCGCCQCCATCPAEQDLLDGLLEGLSHTRPEVWRGLAVPSVPRSGNHALIDRWRGTSRWRGPSTADLICWSDCRQSDERDLQCLTGFAGGR